MNYDRIMESANYIKSKIKTMPKVAIILGSGLGDLADTVEDAVKIKYEDIPNFPVSTVQGHEGQFVVGKFSGKDVFMMQGRFHFYEGYSMDKVIMPIYVMKALGIETLFLTNAAGGVNENFKAGDLMIINDHINLCGTNPLIGPNDERFGKRFPDMSFAYNRELLGKLRVASKETGVDVVEGVYAMFSGPSYETRAEVRMARTLGADAVGMSTVPEAIAAAHAGIKTMGISCITNMAAGILDVALDHSEVVETSLMAKERFTKLVKKAIEMI